MSDDVDLSGEWNGVYNYPVQVPPVAFEAVVQDKAGRLSGTTVEVAGMPFCPAQKLTAVVDGTHEGHNVQFLKMYDRADTGFDSVQYSGRIDPDGDEISGTWSVASMSGTFLMVRRSKASEEAALAVEEKIAG